MNIQLSGTEEFIDGKSTGTLGQVLIRYGLARVLCVILRFWMTPFVLMWMGSGCVLFGDMGGEGMLC